MLCNTGTDKMIDDTVKAPEIAITRGQPLSIKTVKWYRGALYQHITLVANHDYQIRVERHIRDFFDCYIGETLQMDSAIVGHSRLHEEYVNLCRIRYS